jgi:hypothetical protein
MGGMTPAQSFYPMNSFKLGNLSGSFVGQSPPPLTSFQ